VSGRSDRITERVTSNLLVQAFLVELIISLPLATPLQTKAFKLELVALAHVIPWRCCSPHARHGQRPRAPLTVSTPNDPSLVDGREGGAGAVSASPRSPHLPLLLGKHYSTAPPSPSAAVVVSRQTWTSLVPVRMAGPEHGPKWMEASPVTPVGLSLSSTWHCYYTTIHPRSGMHTPTNIP